MTLPGHQQWSPNGSDLDLRCKIEALLFVADEPASISQLAQVLEASESDVAAALEELAQQYQARGLRLQRKERWVQLVTAPEAAPYIRRFLGLDSTSKLSTAALETLALIAYRQPITRAQMEAVRGVNCDGVLRTLLARGLVAPQGRLEQAGRPIIYGVTFEFLQHFGLSDLRELPDWEEFTASTEGGEQSVPGRAADKTSQDPEV